jgi:phosphohistidine phosphatase
MLLRHAKAVPAGGAVRDYERTLDARGRQDASKIGTYMARHGLVPSQVIASPSKRTRETWTLAGQAFATAPPAIYDERLYDASPQAIMEIISEANSAAPRLLVIGHNPGLHKLAVQLIATGDVNVREQLWEELPTSGLVTIDFAFDDWKKLHPHAGRLSHFVTPRSLQAATD